ncbi:MAG: hypothetical protein IKW58_02240 [Alphaproteobacteria bacterium]|nr:hypothetical protein [Alphaproteobacteria bacterium]
MKILFYIYCSLFCMFFSYDTHARTYTSNQIERFVNKTPRKMENNISSLVNYLTKPFDNDYDKAKAISFWIASRISYDEYLYNNGGATRLRNTYFGQRPAELLQSRVGICGDFANLFKEMCSRAGIRANNVIGYTFPANQRLNTKVKSNSGHVWNYFIFNNKKIYVDTTFMADGRTGVSGSGGRMNRNRTLRKIKNDNKYKSQTNDFDEFYFDFSYDKEKSMRYYKRVEK